MLGNGGNSLVNALECALDGEIVLEFDGHLLPCEGLECRKDELLEIFKSIIKESVA